MPKFRSPSADQSDRLRRFCACGVSAKSICRSLDITPKNLECWLVELGLRPLKLSQPRRVSALATNEAVDFREYYATMPMQREVLACYNISVKTFNSWLEQLGLEKHPPKARRQHTRQSFDCLVEQRRVYPKKNPAFAIVITPSQNSFSDLIESSDRESLAVRFRRVGQVALNPHR